ncbi:hypothetical protein [Prauserella alba]|uniref:Lipoprotein n=1 Tax=Prauserella alba TaxID=176898 RepID=A0ABP4FWG9_9PSEU|nr:hypothetical protein [Prauserella alba]MCP2181748.1 hypothetical protein [Prauserella alba]
MSGLSVLAVLGGCGADGQTCTAIGSPPGISIDGPGVPDALLGDAVLEACWNGDCREHDVRRWSSDRQHGFAEIRELPAEPVRVTLVAEGRRLGPVTVTPEPTWPNGEECPAGGPAASITVDRNGTVRPD